MKLEKEEWNQLDSLLGKLGFGGYYDLMELLRGIAYNLLERKNPSYEAKDALRIGMEKDMPTLVALILFLSKGDKK